MPPWVSVTLWMPARNEVQGISPHGSGPLGFYQMQRTAWLDE